MHAAPNPPGPNPPGPNPPGPNAGPSPRVCPWQLIRTFDNRIRYWIHKPRQLFAPFVRPGMTVLDVGCGAGFATLALADLVGPEGRVIAADLQPEMLAKVAARAEAAGLRDRIRLHQCASQSIGIPAEEQERLGFALAFWMVHEVPDLRGFLAEIWAHLEPGGCLFVAEPRFHVTKKAFGRERAMAAEVGFGEREEPRVRLSHAVVLDKPA